MRSEINQPGREIGQPASLQQPKENLFTTAPEIVLPASEYAPLPDEFGADSSQSSDSSMESQDRERKRKEHRSHNVLVRLMVYGVACFLAVIILATTLYNQDIRDNVIAAGGSVDGDLRFTIQWNDIEENQNDFDAHCIEPNGYELFYGNRGDVTPCGGTLDVDIIEPLDVVAIENIVYEKKSTMEDGTYTLTVVCYNNVGFDGGFRAQVELNGRIYNFEYEQPMETGETVTVAIVTLQRGRFTITPMIGSKSFW